MARPKLWRGKAQPALRGQLSRQRVCAAGGGAGEGWRGEEHSSGEEGWNYIVQTFVFVLRGGEGVYSRKHGSI